MDEWIGFKNIIMVLDKQEKIHKNILYKIKIISLIILVFLNNHVLSNCSC